MRILTIMSEEEEESIHDNADLSNSEEEEASTEPETIPVAPELEPGPEVEIISSVTEESGVAEAATEEAMREQSQLIPQTLAKPKKQTKNTMMKIQKSLSDTSKQIERQTAPINKINQNLQSLQKQFKLGRKQSEILIQMRSQINQIQRQISQVQKSIKRR
jgi:predicted RNase H-like nuclease (RuvC/YqgF family)